MNKKYIVRLTEEKRAQLSELVNKGQAAAYQDGGKQAGLFVALRCG